jgi:polyisoprenoid-binding protein YceI
MNARILRVVLAGLIVAVAASSGPACADVPIPRTIDTAKSTAKFTVAHVFVERVTGTVPILSGTLTFATDSAIPTSVSALLDPTKISTGEPDRDGALKSPDFFDATAFPTWSFASTKITPQGANTFEMDGTLTIHGVAQPERLSVTIGGMPSQPLYHAVGEIDRHAFGMSKTRLDPVIGNSVSVAIDIALR